MGIASRIGGQQVEIPSGRAGHGQPGGPGWPQYRGEDEYARRDAVSTVLHICIVSKVVMICSGILFSCITVWNFFPLEYFQFASLTFFALLFKPLLALLTFACCHLCCSLTAFSHFTLTCLFFFSLEAFTH